jgi:hypothetical protein
MSLRHRHSTWILPLLLLTVLLAVLSCAPAPAGPRAWIDWPPQGFETSVGTTLTLIAHAYAEEGVAGVRLEVDRQPYRLVSPEQAGEQFVQVSAEWFADQPGTYLLSVTTLDVNGQPSNPASVSVSVTGEAPGLRLTPSPLTTVMTTTLESPTVPPPTQAPPPPSAAAQPATGTSLPPTATQPPPTATLEPPRIVSFDVDHSQITAGECVRFSWRVEGYPTAVYFDGEGVTNPSSARVCLAATRDFGLRAEGPSGVDTRSITVVVIQPSPTPDTAGPPAPSLVSPTGNAEQGCGAVNLRWSAVSDPSGIATYYVKVEKVTGTSKSGAWTTNDTELTIPAAWLECGQGYQWAVRAEDGAGNLGPLSTWDAFTVTLS